MDIFPDRTYVSKAFDFEKIVLLYLLSIELKEDLFSRLNYLKMGLRSEKGDIDIVCIFNPNISVRFQVKSNKSRKNITEGKAKKGIMQLFFPFIEDRKQNEIKKKYILIYEGSSNVKMIRKFKPGINKNLEYSGIFINE